MKRLTLLAMILAIASASAMAQPAATAPAQQPAAPAAATEQPATQPAPAAAAAAQPATAPTSQAADPFNFESRLGEFKLVQEIDCSQPNKDILFLEYPAAGTSKVETILETPCRVLPNKEGGPKYFAYRVGEGKGLKAGACYVLAVDYPEDQPRTLWICNWGCEVAMGFATGTALGDVLKGKYVPHNPESLKYPLSGKLQTWTQLFYLHDRFPEIKRPRNPAPRPLLPADGFWVIVAQAPAFQDPTGAGAAVAKIRLYEVENPAALAVKINFPADLPRRHIFSREEMADTVIAQGHKPEERDETIRGIKNPADWFEYKMRIMQFLGIDTFGRDLLEFGHNQGWDSADGGGDGWVYQSSTPGQWAEILERAAKCGVSVLPMYEYRGSVGGDAKLALGSQHRCRRLDGGETYTNITWCEGNNADIADPDTIADAKKLLDVSLLKFKDKAKFIGAWFRLRPTGMPVSFNDKDLGMFSAEANDGNRISRAHLQADKALLEKYYQWWFGKRRAFFDALKDHLRDKLAKDAFVLYTNDTSEPGRSLSRAITGEGKPDGWQWMQVVVTDDMPTWEKILPGDGSEPYGWIKPYAFKEVVDKEMHLKSLQLFSENWGEFENAHASPPDDPKNYNDADGVMLSYTYNRLYTVSSAKPFDAYRTKGGLTIMRHYSLNENEMNDGNDEILGYFVVDVERAGPYCMMAEARAMANGDPWYLGSLPGNTNNRGFPTYVRKFNAAFLALPALPSEVVKDAASDKEVVVRAIKTPAGGTYLAVVNTGFEAKKDVAVTLPAGEKVTDAATGESLTAEGGKLTITLHPAELRAILVK